MSKAEDFIKREKDNYGKIFVDISYAIDNVSPFLTEDVLKNRKYVAKIPILKKYIELLDAAQSELNKKQGFLAKLTNDQDKYINLLEDYKKENLNSFEQLEKCSKCQCLNCTADCKFDSCLGCKSNSNIIQCDHKKVNVTKPDNFFLNLTNNNTGQDDRYIVLATLQDIELDRKYIIIQNLSNNDKFILYYYPGISEDNYGEITDAEEFDFVVSTFQGI